MARPADEGSAAWWRRHYALGLLTFTYAVAFVDRQILAIVQESVKRDLSLSDTQLGLLTGFAFSVVFVLAGIPIARLADRSIRRDVIALSLMAWSAMTALTGFATSMTLLSISRVGVGIGEAGCSPPSYSIITDLYAPGRRAIALSVYTTGGGLGMLFGFLMGGWLNEVYGWRFVFIALGVPGLLLAMVIRLTLREPRRGQLDALAPSRARGFRADVGYLTRRKTLRYLGVAVALSSLLAYGIINWSTAFFIRNFQLGTAWIGLCLALAFGVAGISVSLLGGLVSDMLGRRDSRWYMWLPGAAALIMAPLLLLGFQAPTATLAMALLVPVFALCSMFTGMSLSVLNSIAPPDMRATASALFLLVTNLCGLGVGSLAIGWLSDRIAPSFGSASLGVALTVILPITAVLAALHFFLAARTIRDDMGLTCA